MKKSSLFGVSQHCLKERHLPYAEKLAESNKKAMSFMDMA